MGLGRNDRPAFAVGRKHGWWVLAGLMILAPPMLGEESPCLRCHESTKGALQKKVVHAAVEMGCEACHVDHSKAASETGSRAPYLNAVAPELCGSCHDLTESKLVDTHRGQPFAKADCTGCHDPHSSDAPKLLQTYLHPAFDADSCATCHEAPQNGEIRLTSSSPNALCAQCHAEEEDRWGKAKSKHSLLAASEDSCLTCHNPHATSRPRLLKATQPKLCDGCHGVAEDKRFVHEPAQVGCTICHDPHASDSPKNLRASVNQLCMECHSKNSGGVVSSTGPLRLYGGQVTFASTPFKRVQLLDVNPDAAVGHPMAGHPLSMPASDGNAEINCVSCHDPHAGDANTKRFRTQTATSTPLCVKCHG